jgi:hypothetical protein
MSKIAKSLSKKIGHPDIVEKLSKQFSLSELNSLLLELFREKASQISPSELQKNYEQNRFVSFSQYDPVAFREFEISVLKLAKEHGFIPLELSPVSPLGSCSVIATVDQNKIVSASRGTEVVADATNVLALECSKIRKQRGFNNEDLQYCTIHKHIRAQQIGNTRGHTAHFKIFCAVTSGRDTGSFEFEKNSLLRHLCFYEKFFKEVLQFDHIILRFKALNTEENNSLFAGVSDFIESNIKGFTYQRIKAEQSEQQYYKSLQFKIYLTINNKELDIGDGGFVDWTQKLTGNKKERLLISGIGIEYLFKILNGLI